MPPVLSPSICKNLIRRSIDLRQLYRQAGRTCEPGLRLVLAENAHTLDLLIADLQAQLRTGGETPPDHESWHGALRRCTSRCLVHLGGNPDSAWLRELLQREGALLCAFEQAVAGSGDGCEITLRRQLLRLRSIQLDMHNLAGTVRP